MKKDKVKKQAVEQEQPVAEAQPETVEAEEPMEPEVSAEAPAEESAQEATIDQWREALELAVKQRDDYLDSLRRTQADFQNFKRRNQTSRADGYQEGICETVTAMLPVIDNLERALAAAPQEDPLSSGVQMTLKLMLESLKPFGFEEVPALGEDFDPEKHNAVMREAGEEPGKVLEVFQKGYKVRDKIIRYAMVKVSVEA
ncbi:MAG: nucleotide exchange factor GrpE [Clostridiales bacterium]|nr:nucleotide exchange factor GrpE [Clostridiales bacterium]